MFTSINRPAILLFEYDGIKIVIIIDNNEVRRTAFNVRIFYIVKTLYFRMYW